MNPKGGDQGFVGEVIIVQTHTNKRAILIACGVGWIHLDHIFCPFNGPETLPRILAATSASQKFLLCR